MVVVILSGYYRRRKFDKRPHCWMTGERLNNVVCWNVDNTRNKHCIF
jgi:hypothetical protein